MSNDDLLVSVEAIVHGLPCSITLPAGSGKTELIAAVVAKIAAGGGVVLVLTHTHAGVDALRRRMRRFGVPRDGVAVRTIDSWSFDLIRHFPDLAGLQVPEEPIWADVARYHQAATKAVGSRAVRRMLQVSYRAILVDEYQDCLVDQHALVLSLRAAVPTAVFGDPLQGLFSFGSNRPVVWADDVVSHFPEVLVASYPWRWREDNPDLGEWLISIRSPLLASQAINLSNAPVTWVQSDGMNAQNRACFGAPNEDGNVVALGRFRRDCVAVASRLQGTYSVMEALDEKNTAEYCARFGNATPAMLAEATVQFAVDCATGVATYIQSVNRRRLGSGTQIRTTKDALRPAFAAVNALLSNPTPESVRRALIVIGELPHVRIYCREAWREVLDALRHASLEDGLTPASALVRLRNQARLTGRRAEPRVISRPRLVKGLEYKHVILLDADQYSAVELYVALTRGSKSVTVLSRSPVITPRV